MSNLSKKYNNTGTESMNTAASVKEILIDVLQLSSDVEFDEDTPLLGAIPEFDSMAVVTVLTSIEDTFGVEVDDDEISADIFETFGALCGFVETKV
ncbi:MAG: acyl carrier protein [Aliiglaciecola sp.]|uniref:acyl carrier protein n=1 Tax=Aliiglaciecola sp. TaxID=1872441 RepID=UPI0032981B4F